MHPRRSRSPYRGGTEGQVRQQQQIGSLPLVDLLLHLQILDDKSAEFLGKVPVSVASDALMQLGPEVRNPSAFITKRLTEALGGQSVESSHVASGQMSGGVRDVLAVHFQGQVLPFEWRNVQHTASELLQCGILDSSSADFLSKAPEEIGKEIVASLTADVRNPSAFVTKKLKEFGYGSGSPGQSALPPLMAPNLQGVGHHTIKSQGTSVEFVEVYRNGLPIRLDWTSQEAVAHELFALGMLDEVSADFLLKAPEDVAKNVVRSLGPDVRNPSAYVTKKLNENLGGELRVVDNFGKAAACPTVTIYFNGQQKLLEWSSKEQAIGTLFNWGVIDETSADYLMKATDTIAREVVSMLGPDVRNPSAYVTNKLKSLNAQGFVQHGIADLHNGAHNGCGGFGSSGCRKAPSHDSGFDSGVTEDSGGIVNIYINGSPMQLTWTGKDSVSQQLASWGVLDQGSADYLRKASDQEARDIIAALGPDVRNPSAFVTKRLRQLGEQMRHA